MCETRFRGTEKELIIAYPLPKEWPSWDPVLEGWWLFDVLVEVQRIASNGRLVVVMEVVVVLKHGQVHSGNPSVLFLLERGSATRF